MVHVFGDEGQSDSSKNTQEQSQDDVEHFLGPYRFHRVTGWLNDADIRDLHHLQGLIDAGLLQLVQVFLVVGLLDAYLALDL